MALAAGTLLGRYRIRSSLGAGGMGEVYLAEDTQLGRTVALKILPAELLSNQKHIHRFVQEARTASALNHPNIVTIHEIELSSPRPFMVTEYIDGMNLRIYLAHRKIELEKALNFALQITGALAAAHKAGVIHRDIKPENIMIRSDGYIKVLDFGLAKLAAPPDTTPDALTLLNTDTGIIVGTPLHMSPEQARGLEIDERSDIFSLGTVLYEMFTGITPFEGPTKSDIIASLLRADPPPLEYYAPETPPELQRIVNRALAKDREERYQTAKDLFTDLKNLKRELVSGVKGGSGQHSTAETGLPAAAGARSSAVTGPIVGTTPTAKSDFALQATRRHWLVASLVVLTLIGIAGYFYFRSPTGPIDSVAVLPFANVGGDANTEYLSDGLTESLINSLSHIDKLRVIAPGSVFRYKGKPIDPQAIGRELNVRAVLSGKVVQLGDTLSIQTELIDVAKQTQLWGERYSRKVSDILAVQDEISTDISANLRLTLTGEQKKELAKHYTQSAEAYQLYWKGRYRWNQRTPEDTKEAIRNFQQAINIDPQYSLAYTGLADCYVLGGLLQLAPKEAMPIALDATKRALAIDSKLAEAHTSLAKIKLSFEWDWPGAESEFKQAIQLNPGYATAHQWYGVYLSEMGRHDESMKERQSAKSLDPLSLSISTGLGRAFFWAHRYDEAIDHLKRTIEEDPKYADTYWSLGLTYEQKEMYPEAIASFQKAVEYSKNSDLTGGKPEMIAALGHAYARAGKRAEALKTIADLTQSWQHGTYVSPYSIALIHVALGDKVNAFEWLNRAYQERDESFIHLRVDPRLDDLRPDPRFAELLRRINLA